MHNIIPYLAIVIIFILNLISKISINPSLRGKLSAVSIFGILVLCAYFLCFHIDNISYMSAAHIFVYIIGLPEVIARLVNIRRIEPTSIQISVNSSYIVLGSLGTGIFSILSAILIYFLFKAIESPNSEIVFDIKYFLIRLNTLLVFISGTIWMYLLATQKTIFYSEGLFYNGKIWKWSDFAFYSWNERTFENDVKELALASVKHGWHPAKIKLKLPSGSKKQIDVLLEKNLEKLGVLHRSPAQYSVHLANRTTSSRRAAVSSISQSVATDFSCSRRETQPAPPLSQIVGRLIEIREIVG